MKTLKGIKQAVIEANRVNNFAIFVDTEKNEVYTLELVSLSDEPNTGDQMVMKADHRNGKLTMNQVKEAINNSYC